MCTHTSLGGVQLLPVFPIIAHMKLITCCLMPILVQYNYLCLSLANRWSFGVVLWEIYTFGHIPYPGMSASQVVSRTKAGYRMPQPEKCPSDM